MRIYFEDVSGEPTVNGQYFAALMIVAVYQNDLATLRQLAVYVGGGQTRLQVDPLNIVPDWAIITSGNNVYVALAGATNNYQVANVVSGAVVEEVARGIPAAGLLALSVNWGVQYAADIVEPFMLQQIGTMAGKNLYVMGHSYGGATANVLSRRWANRADAPSKIEVLTFGEPKSMTGGAAAKEPAWKRRIITWQRLNTAPAVNVGNLTYQQDVVTLLPPPGSLVSVVFPPLYWLSQAFRLVWAHQGDPVWLSADGKINTFPLEGVAAALSVTFAIADIALSAAAQIHNMWQTYLPWSQLRWQGVGDPALGNLSAFAAQAQQSPAPLPASTGGQAPNQTLNQGTFNNNSQPVDASSRPVTTIVSVSVYTVPERELLYPYVTLAEELGMSIYKGTIEYNSVGWGGWSESVYSDVIGETQQSMIVKMTNLLRYRMLLCNGPDAVGCTNPVVPFAIRVEDELVNRDGQVVYCLQPGGPPIQDAIQIPPSFSPIFTTPVASLSNLDMQLGSRVKFQAGGNQQIATPMFHGMPVYGLQNVLNTSPTLAFLRQAPPTGNWLQNLSNYTQYMAQAGLGFRNITGAWNGPQNTPGPFAAPMDWYYNPSLEMIELQWKSSQAGGGILPIPNPLPNPLPTSAPYYPNASLALQASSTWPALNAKCRLQVRGWKTFPVLNSRWTAQVVAPYSAATAPNSYSQNVGPYNFALRILRKVRMPQDVSVPFVSPIAWTVWWPGEFLIQPNGSQSQLAGGVTSGGGSNVVVGIGTIPGQPPAGFGTWADFLRAMGKYQYIQSKKLGRIWGSERGRQRNRAS